MVCSSSRRFPWSLLESLQALVRELDLFGGELVLRGVQARSFPLAGPGLDERVPGDGLAIRRVASDGAVLAVGLDEAIFDLLAPFVQLRVVGDAALQGDIRPFEGARDLVDDQV